MRQTFPFRVLIGTGLLVLGTMGICQSPRSQAPTAPTSLNMLWEDGEPLILTPEAPRVPVWPDAGAVPPNPPTTDKFGYVLPTRVTI